MHSTRIMALVGAVIGIIGLFMKALSTAGAEYLPKIAEGARAMGSDKEIPESIPTIWQGLDSFEKPMVVIAIVITVVLAVIGARKAIMNMASSIVVLVLGVGLFIYALLKWLDTADKAGNDLLFAGLGDGEIDHRFAGLDAIVSAVGNMTLDRRGFQEGLGRDTAPIQAGSPKSIFFDKGNVQAGRSAIQRR